MIEYVSKACPFCGGTQIDRAGDAYICAYCLQPLDVSSGVLSDGYNKLASFNFAGAAAFFRSMTASAGAEAFYGLFLAKYKIAENKQGGQTRPVVLGYYPASFEQNEDYRQVRRLCESNASLLTKLDRIEQARAQSTGSEPPVDVLVFCDGGGKEGAQRFADAVSACGRKALVCEQTPSLAVLRAAQAAYGFFDDLQEIERLLCGNARYFPLLENARTELTGAKRPIKIECSFAVPDALKGGAATFADISAAAEVRRLHALLGGRTAVPSLPLRFLSAPVTKRRASTAHAATDVTRLQRLLYNGDFAGALRETERAADGTASAAVFWCGFLACARARDDSALVASPNENAFTAEALGYASEALYRCADHAAAQPYLRVLTDTALRCIDRGFLAFAARAVDTAFCYDYADDYADKLLARLHAAHGGLPAAEAFALGKKIIDKLSAEQDASRLRFALQLTDDALRAGEWALADDCIESLLDRFGTEKELYLRKWLISNRVCDTAALRAVPYPRLGENFAFCLAVLPPESRATLLKDTFNGVCRAAAADGFAPREAALGEALALGRALSLFAAPVFGATDYCAVGDLALREKDFESAAAYFAGALRCDGRSYRAHWGALCAALQCENDRRLEECATPIDRAGDCFENAYTTALGRDEAFIARIEGVRARQRETVRKDGHVFRPSDFVIDNGCVRKYTGEGTPNVFVSGVTAIGDGAFRGADAVSVLVDEGVTAIGDGAFAYSALRSLRLPDSVVRLGANPFVGCDDLVSLTAAGKIRVENGGVYRGDRLAAFVPSLAQSDAFAALRSTSSVADRAFYGVHGGSIDLGNAALDPCALYACEGVAIKAARGAAAARTGESVTGCDRIENGKIVSAGKARWASLYGNGGNNMAADGNVLRDGNVRVEKIADTPRLQSGILCKNDRLIYAHENALYVVPAAGGRAERLAAVGECTGTGVLWNEYIVQPVETQTGAALCFVAPNGKTEYTVSLPERLTRPLCLSGDTLLCVSDRLVTAVHLPTGKTRGRVMPARVTSVPCAAGNGFVLADEQHVYALDTRLQGEAVHALTGGNYAQGQGKICRNRIVGYKGTAYWVERTDANVCIGMYNGVMAGKAAVPRRIADFLQTQPVLYGDTLYAGGNTHVITARISSVSGEWTFGIGDEVGGKYAELAVIGGACYINAMEGAYGRLRLRAVADGKAIVTDIDSGGIYAARI